MIEKQMIRLMLNKKFYTHNWNSWRYDIKDMNRSDWTVRDQSIMDTIDMVLRKEFGSDRKTND